MYAQWFRSQEAHLSLGHLERSFLAVLLDRGGSDWEVSLTQLNHGQLRFFEVPTSLSQ
jgi:hypothetical protein